jgi:gamma-glutamylcyclotransferase (GGCT)/AIG2-like uncharacterized protein YtfP
MPEHSIFVYGSLLRGERAHGLLGDGHFLAAAGTLPAYRLLDLCAYPGLVDNGGVAVEGEVYAISAQRLAELDRYEGHPDAFRRGPVALAPPWDGGVVEAWFYRGPMSAGLPFVGGDWRTRAQNP